MEGFLLYLVCYDVGFILYGALAVIWIFSRGAVRRADVSIGPYEWVVGADDPVRPGPITQRLVGQGPCALPGSAGKIRFGPSRTPAPTEV